MTDSKPVRITPPGTALGILFAVSFVLCVGILLMFSGAAMHQAWLPLLSGVSSIGSPSAMLGLAERFADGWYIALIVASALILFDTLTRLNMNNKTHQCAVPATTVSDAKLPESFGYTGSMLYTVLAAFSMRASSLPVVGNALGQRRPEI